MEIRDIKGMAVAKRRLIQKRRNVNAGLSARWIYDDFVIRTLIIFFTVLSLTGIVTDAYGITFHKFICYSAMGLIAAVFTVYYSFERFSKYRWVVSLWLMVLPCILAAVTWNRFRLGGVSIVNDMIGQINKTYNGTIEPLSGAGGGQSYVLAFFLFFATWFIAKGVVDARDNLHLIAIMFPVIVVSVIGGGSVSKIYFVMLLLCFVVTTALSGVRKRMKFWGGKGSRNYEDNCVADSRIRGKLLLFSLVLCLVVGGIAYKIYNPILEKPLSVLGEGFSPIKTDSLRMLQDFVPKISGGKLNFTTEGVGGGVSGGILGEIEGTFYTTQESIKVTCTTLPKETVYLKGFIGTTYTGRSWEERDESAFNNLIKYWEIEGNNSLYIQNLPFLRMAYVLQEKSEEMEELGVSEPEYMTVEHMNEDTISYTYVPYQAYLNDYYTILGGDGGIKGQTVYEDTFAWFETSDFKAVMEKYHNIMQESSTLDELAYLYENYVNSADTKTGDYDFGEISRLCRAKREEWEAKFGNNMTDKQRDDLTAEKYEDMIQFVRRTLLERYEFEAEAQKLPEDKDFINYFVNELKKGDSTAFASTAVMMFRMCGIPARYVEGYVAPLNIFSEADDGSYYAVLQDDNAHAWVEIYMPYTGWVPVETTPGFDGTISNLPLPEEEETESPADENSDNPEANEDGGDRNITHFILDKFVKLLLYALLIVCLAFVLVGLRYFVIYYSRRNMFGKMSDTDKIKRLFYSFYEVLLFDGFDQNIDTTGSVFNETFVLQYAQFGRNEIDKYMNAVLRVHYTFDNPKKGEAEYALKMYEKLVETVGDKFKGWKKLQFKIWKAF